MEWMTLPLRRYFQFSGRSRRKEFWMFWLFTILVGIAAGIVDNLLGYGRTTTYSAPGTFNWSTTTSGPVNAIATLLLLIPSLAVSIRRLHDTGRSGWWYLLIFLPILGWIALFVFFVTDGARGPNRFGPDPKDPEVADYEEVFR